MGWWANNPSFPEMEQIFSADFARFGVAVPPEVELGFHLCYGDLDAKHFVQPVDATKRGNGQPDRPQCGPSDKLDPHAGPD